MQILETHATNDKEALELAIKYLNISPDDVEIKLHQKGSSGFLGLGEKTPSVYHVLAIEGKTPLQVVIKGVVATLLYKMGYQAQFARFETVDEGKLYVEIASPHAGYIIGKKGKTLESLQFLVNLLVEKFTKEPPKILLDIENYRGRRAQHLENLANRTAAFVIRSGKSKLLDPLNPYERRLIHMALQENAKIKTESEGQGIYKRVKIFRVGPGDEKKGDATSDNLGNVLEDKMQEEAQHLEQEAAVLNEQLEEQIPDDIGNRA